MMRSDCFPHPVIAFGALLRKECGYCRLYNTHSLSRLRPKPCQARASWVIGCASSAYDSRPLRWQVRRLTLPFALTPLPIFRLSTFGRFALQRNSTLAPGSLSASSNFSARNADAFIPTPPLRVAPLRCRARLHHGLTCHLRLLFRLVKVCPPRSLLQSARAANIRLSPTPRGSDRIIQPTALLSVCDANAHPGPDERCAKP